jgi:hypothetical protein
LKNSSPQNYFPIPSAIPSNNFPPTSLRSAQLRDTKRTVQGGGIHEIGGIERVRRDDRFGRLHVVLREGALQASELGLMMWMRIIYYTMTTTGTKNKN